MVETIKVFHKFVSTTFNNKPISSTQHHKHEVFNEHLLNHHGCINYTPVNRGTRIFEKSQEQKLLRKDRW